MKALPNLHLVMYSQLHESGGGRETWLRYFLPAVAEAAEYSKIYVYGLKPQTGAASLLGLMERLGTESVLADFDSRHRGRPLYNVARYALHTYRAMRSRLRADDRVILIGTMAEGAAGILCMHGLPRRGRWATWLRSIHVGELGTYRSRLLVAAARRIERHVLERSELILANGQDTLAHYAAAYPALAGRFRLVPNAVDAVRFDTLPRPSFNDRPLRVAYLGRLAKAKGFLDFARAAQSCRDSQRQLEFHAWGHGMAESEIPTGIRWHGAFAPCALPDVLAQTDAVAFLNYAAAGRAGGLSHSLLEVLAAGRLAIAWNNTCHCQILDPTNAILVPEGDVTALSSAFQNLPRIPASQLSQMAGNAELRARRFSPAHHIACFNDAMKSLA